MMAFACFQTTNEHVRRMTMILIMHVGIIPSTASIMIIITAIHHYAPSPAIKRHCPHTTSHHHIQSRAISIELEWNFSLLKRAAAIMIVTMDGRNKKHPFAWGCAWRCVVIRHSKIGGHWNPSQEALPIAGGSPHPMNH